MVSWSSRQLKRQDGACARSGNTCARLTARHLMQPLSTQGMAVLSRFLNLNRPFSCVCCCFNRPKADIHYVPSGLKIGSISDPWTCLCNYRFNIQDVDGSNVLRVDGGCCQWGIIAPCPCGPCSRVTFDVSDLATGRNVATLVKHNPGLISCRRRCCPHVNYYSVKFANVDARSKALLIATSIFLDFRFFNTKDSPDEPKETNPLDGVQDQS